MHSTGHFILGASAIVSGTVSMRSRKLSALIHRVAVEQQHGAGDLAVVGLVQGAFERQRVGGDGYELRAHLTAVTRDW